MKIALAFLLLALLAPATASAQAPPPGERAAAQALADATKRAFDDIEALFDYDAPSRDCEPLDSVPERHQDDAFTLVLAGGIRQAAPAITPRMRQLRTELANVQTADPALISGRASWRRWLRSIETVEPYRGDLCDLVGDWRKAGYPRAAIREAVRVLVEYVPTRGVQRRTKAASRRMIELGVSRKLAARFDLSG